MAGFHLPGDPYYHELELLVTIVMSLSQYNVLLFMVTSDLPHLLIDLSILISV